MDEESELVNVPARLPKKLKKDLTEAAKKHRRSFNSEVIVAIETYLADWKNKQ